MTEVKYKQVAWLNKAVDDIQFDMIFAMEHALLWWAIWYGSNCHSPKHSGSHDIVSVIIVPSVNGLSIDRKCGLHSYMYVQGNGLNVAWVDVLLGT